MPKTTLIHNARIVNEGKPYAGWVLIDGEFIAATGKGRPSGISNAPQASTDSSASMPEGRPLPVAAMNSPSISTHPAYGFPS